MHIILYMSVHAHSLSLSLSPPRPSPSSLSQHAHNIINIVGMAATPPSDQASVLYSSLSGDEILQQWLAKHPEVVQRHQKMKSNSSQQSPNTSSL